MHDFYEAPWAKRYSSENMLRAFSDDKKYSTWRKLWLALAEAQHELGLPVSAPQLQQLREHLTDINYARVKTYEDQIHHDVMAHIKALADVAPDAAPIIHWGATSAFVTDNGDIIQIKEGLEIIRIGLVRVINNLSIFAWEHKALPCLAYTHFQPAQLTTVGKRACLWIQSFLIDLRELNHILDNLVLRGAKGAVGTGSAFHDLFEGDYPKYTRLEQIVAKKMGFSKTISVSGQTYDRKIDSLVVNLLGQIAQSAHKMTNDIRLLQHLKELEEVFEENQVGSSAMPYKRNPILSERIAALSKFVMALGQSSAMVTSTQWLERTLDDSANKRLTIPQAFLGVDALLMLCDRITSSFTVYPKVIEKHINAELPFIATEALLMEAVRKGGDRQKLHEIIRSRAMQAGFAVKELGEENKLLSILAHDTEFPLSEQEIKDVCASSNFTGFAEQQCVDFLQKEVAPILKQYDALLPNT
ncbi:MAG: adenylosuccinate lyase [Brevinema sp.]